MNVALPNEVSSCSLGLELNPRPSTKVRNQSSINAVMVDLWFDYLKSSMRCNCFNK